MGSEIVLVRHGRPLMADVSPITGAELGAFVRRYSECGINQDVPPPDALRQLASTSARILSSGLPRSVESASWLSSKAEIDADLREAGLPDRLSIPIRLNPAICVALARVSWWMNWSQSAETITDARERARRVSERLCTLAREHGSVLVVGHGMFNRFIGTCLRKRGWSGPRLLPSDYWSMARFVLNP